MPTLVWEIGERYGWATIHERNFIFTVCCVYRLNSGLWAGEYVAGPDVREYTRLPGAYPLEELQGILETTISLLVY